MASVCFYFQVHQPYRIKKYNVFDIGEDHNYFETDDDRLSNRKIFNKVAEKCYLPTNKLLLKLLKRHPEFRFSFSISGVFLDQALQYNPEVIESFKRLAETGRVEFIDETYYHSLSFLYSHNEFKNQVKLHRDKIKELFDYTPRVFRNTELIYNNELASVIEGMGYDGIITEGVDRILTYRSPNFLYQPVNTSRIKLLLKNYKLSDDIAFRFSNVDWSEHPLHAPKFAQWVNAVNGNGHVVNLFMDYETFGEHQWEHTGIFNFMDHLPGELLKHPDNDFVTPSEAIDRYDHSGQMDIHNFVSWADEDRDLSAWLSNSIQNDAARKIYELEELILESGDLDLIEDWRRMQTSDHFYYMCTKYFSDGDVHKYFNPYETPYDAFINFMHALNDLKLRGERAKMNREKMTNKEVKSGKLPSKNKVKVRTKTGR